MTEKSWDEIDQYRGSLVKGEWPTVPELFLMSEDRYGSNVCFSVIEPKAKIEITYKEAKDYIFSIASYLRDKGLKAGDKVALNGKNSPEWALSYFAITTAGGVVVPFDNQMKIERFMTLCEYADVRFVLADYDVLEKMKAHSTPWFETVLGLGMLKGTKDYVKVTEMKSDDMLASPVERDCTDLAAILFTSGTTGNEKGAMLTHKNVVSNVYQAANGMGVTDKDVLYALLPLHHSYCCTAVLLESVRHGSECLFGHGIILSRMLNDLKNGHVTVFMGIPLLYNKLIAGIFKKIKEQGAFKYNLIRFLMTINGWCKKAFGKAPLRGFFNRKILSNVGLDHSKLLICGAGPLAPEVFKQYQQFGLNFLQGYGLTETSPIVTLNPPEHFKVESIGRVLPFCEVKIADQNEEGVGEICVKGPNTCLGYYKDEKNTAELFDEEGWLRTGDLGYMDDENYVFLKGRKKNIIVTEGGKNVFPEEIEDMFQLYGEIDQIMIRGFQQKKDVPCECIEAVIYPSPDFYKGKDMDKKAISEDIERVVSLVNKELSGYKKIEKVTVLDEPMQMTTTKKIKRNTVEA